jgi:hypothetical protein
MAAWMRNISVDDPTDNQAWNRALRKGYISEPMADKLAIKYLGMQHELIYGRIPDAPTVP